MATKQLSFENLTPRTIIRPAVDRQAPAFWVKRLVIVRDLSTDAEVIRDIALRPGLNIVWTPPVEANQERPLFQNGIAGHTAGKTTLCRLLRHVLGEQGLLSEGTRRKVRSRFPTGWVLAEIVVETELWVVARPFAIGPHSFSIRGGSVEDALAGGVRTKYQDFLDALASVTVDVLPTKLFPSSSTPVRWDQLLPWLTRDQECRFGDVWEWRHSTSHSDAPELSAAERKFLVRSVLGAIDDAERKEQAKHARLVSKRKEATERIPLLKHQAQVDRERLKATQLESSDEFINELIASSNMNALAQRSQELSKKLAVLSSDVENELLVRATQANDAAVAAETNAQRDFDNANDRLQLERNALSALEEGDSSSIFALLGPAREYCNQPMHVAVEHNCPLAYTRPSSIPAKRSERVADEDRKKCEERVSALEKIASDMEAILNDRKNSKKEAGRQRLRAWTSQAIERDRILMELTSIKEAERRLEYASWAQEEISRVTTYVSEMDREIDDSNQRQQELRESSRRAIASLSTTFDYVCRAILGNDVRASVKTSGRSLALTIDHNGERESAAVETVKLLAFDLAAMTESIQGRGYFPRFLVHDGPREADLSADVYANIFHFAREMENCFQESASFQYIVTTTSPPPENLQTKPWLRLELSGLPAENRLFRIDL